MQISYGLRDIGRAEKGCVEVYELAEKRLGAGCLGWNREELRNAFQVLRYAIREWACDKPRGVVWQMLMSGGKKEQEVEAVLGASENILYCDDEQTAEVLEEMLRKEGYEAEEVL